MDDRKRTNRLGLMVILASIWLLGVGTPGSLAVECAVTAVRISPISGHDFTCTGLIVENPTDCYFKIRVTMNGDYPSPFHQTCDCNSVDCDCTVDHVIVIIPPNSTLTQYAGVMTVCSGTGCHTNYCDQGRCEGMSNRWCGDNSDCLSETPLDEPECIHPCTTVKEVEAKIFCASANGTTWSGELDYPLDTCSTTPRQPSADCLPLYFNDVPDDGNMDCIPKKKGVAFMVDDTNGPQVIGTPLFDLNCQPPGPCPAVTSCGGAGCLMGDPEEEVCDSTDTHQTECLEDDEPQYCPIGETIHIDECPCYPSDPFAFCALSHQRWHCK